MKKSIIILLLLPLTIFSQNYKKKKVKSMATNGLFIETYYVRKNDESIKEGEYLKKHIGYIIEEGKYSNNKKIGEWKYYYNSGEIRILGNYSDDKKSSEWKYYYKSGKVRMSGSYSDDKKNGEWKYYILSGKLITKGNFINDKKSGGWKYFDDSNNLNFSGYFNNDLKDGKWTYYLKNQISSEIYYSNEIADSAFGYNKGGSLTYELRNFENGTGLSKSYFNNGKTKEIIELKNREMDGSCKTYFDNGQLHRETIYKESKKTTIISVFDYYGNKIDGGNLKDGSGSYIIFFNFDKSEGTLKKKQFGIYKNGELNGPVEEYYKNGIIESEGSYENGNQIGKWVFYNEDGSFINTFTYNTDNIKNSRTAEKLIYKTENQYSDNDVPPSFIGGDINRIKFIQHEMDYPVKARRNGVSGTVYINFTINELGEIESIKILRGVSKSLDDEAIRVFSTMPRWNPGLKYGIPVRVHFNMPLRFLLAQ